MLWKKRYNEDKWKKGARKGKTNEEETKQPRGKEKGE